YSNYREEYLMAHNFNEDTFIKLVEDLVERSDFYSSGVEFDWAREFIEYVDCADLEIKDNQSAENLAYDLMEIDSLQKELNRIQNENKKREKPIKDRLKMLIYNIT
ncbi:DUF244 domain-containing protein, partial [Borreliella burgdorferi 297]